MALPTQPWEPEDGAPAARVVRPYTVTGGRTAPTVALPFEATLRRQGSGPEQLLDANLARILEVCDTRSVAEVSALVSMPIGVVRVLLGDLVEQGHVRVQATLTADSPPDVRRSLIERTLRGLRGL